MKSSKLHATLITLFPEMVPGPLGYSLTGKALEAGIWSLDTVNLREFGHGKHQTVDDTPYGGGAGMVLRPDVVDTAIAEAFRRTPEAKLIYLTPRGKRFNQKIAAQLIPETCNPEPATLIFLCGRFESVDERVIDKYQPVELSLGDFVMTGGELAAMAMLDACIRLLPGVIGEPESLEQESFGLAEDYALLLEHPHYTKPPVWEGNSVPDILLSGDHAKIARWRHEASKQMTESRRPDLWDEYLKGQRK